MTQSDVSTPDAFPPSPDPDTPTPERRRGSVWRLVFYLATVAVVLWAAVLVPLPYVEYLPGSPTEIEPLIEIEGATTTDLDGETALLTVLLRQQPALQALRAAVSDQRRLLPLSTVFPPDVDRDAFFAREREVFGRQFEIATVIGAQAAGVETRILSEPVVVSVLPGSPAEGVLEPRDVIVSIDGQDVVAAEEVQARTRAGEIDEVVPLEIRRGGDTVQTSIRLGELPGLEHPGIGIQLETAVYDIELPFEVALAPGTRIGGPSAGLMVALTVYDLLSDEDLLQGRLVLGTGTIDADGRVGPVGGVPEKMLAAAAYGADVVLVPESQFEQAMTTAPDDLTVIGVATMDDALAALRDTAGD
ncbi:PDZ domain-containing protein [Egicoccus sp. AB-alg6-2]|uniref:YlbL family protein n=1 Tax=Egicoccus sp. AB-alg6-2 TaxID=3242692 RepID=UPI00359E1C02